MLCNLEAEAGVLCAIFLDEEAAALATKSLQAEDFSSYANSKIFEAACDRANQGMGVDMVTVKAYLQERGEFEKIGGIAYLSQIATSAATSVFVKDHIDLVKQAANRRRYLNKAQKLAELAKEGEYTALLDFADKMQENETSFGDLVSVRDVVEDILKQAIYWRTAGKKPTCTGLKTGFPTLDAYTGGLQKNSLIVLAARPSMGKSAFALDIARGALKKEPHKNIAVFSLEMNREQVTKRLCGGELKIQNDRFKLMDFDETDLEKMSRGIEDLETMTKRLYIDDTETICARDIYTKCHTLRVRTKREFALIIVDYLQLVTGDKSGNREQEISGISRDFKKLAKKFQCPVMVLSQLNRACELRPSKRPQLSDLRESGAIEQDADMVLLLYREEYYFPKKENEGAAELIIAKHRDGACGVVNLKFAKELPAFYEPDKG